MRGLILTAAALALGASLGGCFTEGEVGYTTTPQGTVYDSNPDLVTVSPGVQVVADYDEPVFYTDGFYWRFYDGYWYRSNNYYSGWYFYERPPAVVLRIDRPYAYVHYRPRGYVARSNVRHRRPEVIVRDHRAPVRSSPTIVRDHRDSAPAPVVRDRRDSAPAPVVRDHRDNGPAPVVRDHRANPPAPAPAPPAARTPAPVVRDHRAPDKETRDHRKH